MYSESIGTQDKQFLTYLNLGKSCLEVAQDKLKYYKDCGDVEGILSLEDVFAEYERAIDSLSEAINLGKESFRDFKKAEDILNLNEILTECERSINFLSELISLNEERDLNSLEIQRIKNKAQQVLDEAKQYSMQAKWEEQTTTLIKEELKKFKAQINGHLPINDLKIMVSYVDEGSKTNKAISMLKLIFETLGISVTSREHQNLTTFEQELKKYTHAIILATAKYKEVAASTEKEGEQLRKVLDEFGEKGNIEENLSAKLHVLLCDSDYIKVASQIVDPKYLVRPYQTVFNEKKVWYELDVMSSIVEDLKDSIIYVTKESNTIKYKIKNLINSDRPIEEGIITTQELPILIGVIEAEEELLVLETNKILPDILKITTQRGHTLKECTADFQEQLPILDFIEHLLNPLSYEYESGMLPSMLDITDHKHRDIYKEYKSWFKEFKQKQKMLNIKYRLNKVLIGSIQKDKEILDLTDLDEMKQSYCKELDKQIEDIINNLLQSSNLKSNLILCHEGSDQTLVNSLLKSQLMLKKDVIIVAIDCGRKYKDDTKITACEVNDFLKEKLYLNECEIEEFTKQTKEKMIILFENYERLGVYGNLYVKNELSKWLQLKMLITCGKDFFQHRDYASCILPDPGFMDLNTIKCDEIEGIFLDNTLRKSSIVDRSMLVSYNFDESWRKESKIDRIKRYAQHSELNIFLKNIKSYFQDKIEGIKNAEQIFISYAWEKDSETMMRKQNLLAKIAADLQTLGFFVWLDIERLASNIDQQLDRNILKSRYAFIIGTPSYTKKAADDKTYVYREFKKIISEKSRKLEVFAIKFEEEKEDVKSFPEIHCCEENQVDFCRIDDEEEYIKQLTSFSEGLIPKLMRLNKINCDQELKEKYIKYYEQMQKQLQLLPASHLLVDKGQEDVQSYDIDGRLEVYIEPSGVTANPNQITKIIEKFNLEKSLRDFLQNPNLKTYVALGDAGSGKTLFTLWTFKKYVLQPWHNYRNKNLEIYLCSTLPNKTNIKMNAIYLYLEENQIQYICLVKNYKHESDQETQIVTIDATNSALYKQIKQELETITGTKPLSLNCERDEFFNLLKPKWLPIYIPVKNYSYPGEDEYNQKRKPNDKQTPLRYIEDALLTDYHISSQDIINLKKGLNHEQNVLFILDGYDELGKGNNPNFSQALLSGVEEVLQCSIKPEKIKENYIYIYLNNGRVYFLFKKFDNPNKIINQPINSIELSKELEIQILSLTFGNNSSIVDANLLEELFKYTYKNHKNDLQVHSIRWRYAKIFVTGRPEHFDNEEQHLKAFSILDKNNHITESFKVTYMARFTSEEIEDYINKYKQADPKCEQELAKLEKTHSETIFKILESFANLKELLINPFLLNITLQALPILIKKTDINITRASIYEAFIEYWYTKEIARKEKSLFSCSTAKCYQFAEKLVIQMFIHNIISISEKTLQLWQFFNNPDNTFARETCPLRRSGNEYSFIHKSVYEYLLSRYLMNTSWQEIQRLVNKVQFSIDGIEYSYNSSLARLMLQEPSVFSFIQDFSRPYLSDKFSYISVSPAATQTQNLYSIFLELLRWNEHKLALRLITEVNKSIEQHDDEGLIMLLKNLLDKEVKDINLNITNKLALGTSIYVWNSLKIKEKLILIMETNYIKISNQSNIFLNLIGWGAQEEAEELLKHNTNLTFKYGDLTDCSGRIWQNITALQYSLLALDYHMWNMLLKYIPQEEACAQMEALMKVAELHERQGWVIIDNSINWQSLSWCWLIAALEKYVENYDAWEGAECIKHWCQQIGGAQLILPAHVINEYSHPNRANGFRNCLWGDSSEAYAGLPRTGVVDWINNSDYKLGIQFAWLRSEGEERWRPEFQEVRAVYIDDVAIKTKYVKIDLIALTDLLKSRIEQAKTLVFKITESKKHYLKYTP